jgi:hypothetical protein
VAISGETGRFRFGLALAALLFALFCVPMVRGQVLVNGDLGSYSRPESQILALTTGEELAAAICLRFEGRKKASRSFAVTAGRVNSASLHRVSASPACSLGQHPWAMPVAASRSF